MKKRIITIIFSVLVIGGILFMADKNIQMGQRNATNTEWDNHFPATKAENVITTDGNVASDLASIKINKADKTYVDTLTASIASGSPKGTYLTVADLTTAFPTGNTNIYVVTADGNWYYWNGTVWTSGGAYQSTGIADGSIVKSKLNFAPIVGIKSTNLFDKDTVTVGYYVSHTEGGLISQVSYSASDYIPVLPSTTYTKKTSERFAFYDVNKTYISGTLSATTFTTPANCYYVRITILNTSVNVERLNTGSTLLAYETYPDKINPNTIPNKTITKDMMSFNMLEGIPSKNLFNKTTAISGYYVSVGGELTASASYYASDWIPVTPSTDYARVSSQITAFYDSEKAFISALPSSVTFTTPANCYYLRMTIPIAVINVEQLELGSLSTDFEVYGNKIGSGQINNNGHEVTVKLDGTGNYTNLSSALASIIDSSKSNRYTVYIYEGTYDVYSTLTASELSGIGILLPDGVDLVGVGDRDKIILKMELSDATTNDESTRLSTLNVKYNNNLSNLTVIAKNCRYPIHADNSNTFKNYEQNIDNCVFWHKGAVAGLWQVCNAWGEGTASGATEYFKNCIFRSDRLCGFSTHSNANFTKPTYHQFDNCEFISAIGVGSISLQSMASTKTNKVVFNNCIISGYIGHSEVAGYEGCGMEYEVVGSGNNIVPYELNTTLANDQPYLKFADEIENNRNTSGEIIERGTPLKYNSNGTYGVVPMTSSDTIEVFAGICMEDCAIGDACYYKVRGYYNLSAVSLGTATSGTYIGVTSGQLAVVTNKVDAIGKVIYNGGQLKLY